VEAWPAKFPAPLRGGSPPAALAGDGVDGAAG